MLHIGVRLLRRPKAACALPTASPGEDGTRGTRVKSIEIGDNLAIPTKRNMLWSTFRFQRN
jgi:hypothetical protein